MDLNFTKIKHPLVRNELVIILSFKYYLKMTKTQFKDLLSTTIIIAQKNFFLPCLIDYNGAITIKTIIAKA